MKKALSILLAITMTMILAAGCSPKTPTESGTIAKTDAPVTEGETKASTAAAEKSEVKGKFAMITDIGGINDESFNQSAWNGMEALKARGAEVSFVESKKDADYAPNLGVKVDEKNDLIWGIGFMMKTAVGEAAKDNPDQKFALVDDFWDEGEVQNATGVMFHAEESSFLVGYIASYMTKTNHVGFVLGMEGPTMFRFQYGYLAGVLYGAKEQGKEVKVDAVTIQSFDDTAKGKGTANKMFTDGADIVFHAAGHAGLGVIEAAKEAKKWAIGVDLDQNKLAPDNVLTSALKNVNIAVEDISARIFAGEKLGGQTVYYGLKEGGVGIAPSSSKHVTPDVLEKTKEIEKKIISGEIKVPITKEAFDEFSK